ncbi:unnamed protein product [Rhizoctonia solani]|uniref:FAD dependent oxidoreductase domain-containing protein n=1 Tax=Rhizoctonia solani TaxID=456999 RepID=A0A8H3E700_9AGAM|nr:unnamed protein product [Rhizoctonia solani]
MATPSVLILGAGCFGLSTAYELLQRGYQNVTIVDRAHDLPAPDAASTVGGLPQRRRVIKVLTPRSDLNKIVRSAYRNGTYTRLTQESIRDWKTGDWDNAYHESGVMVCGGADGTAYSKAAHENDLAAGCRVELLPNVSDIERCFPPGVALGEIAAAKDESGGLARNWAYFNKDGGWVAATVGMKALLRRTRAYEGRGLTILTGRRVTGLELDQKGRAGAVRVFANGNEEVLAADVIVLATGAWTSSLFPDESFGLSKHTSLTVQLTPEEYELYKHVPTLFDKETDLYTMPVSPINPSYASTHHQQPTPSGLLKWGIHHKGAVSAHGVSTPRTGLSKDNTSPLSTARVGVDGAGASCAVPKRMLKPMRDAMRRLYPDIADRDFASSRICWYADTTDEDWIIDYHPDHPRLLLATGGSGHGFKFLPVLGRVIADRLENKLDDESRQLFSFTRPRSGEHVERIGESFQILEEELTTPADLKA